jgi:uncharacterized delta-60 repeat protein
LAIARLLPNGDPDPSFGDQGSVLVDLGDFDGVTSIAPVREGAIAAGVTRDLVEGRSGPGDVVVIRVDQRGQLDPRFGVEGTLRLDLGGDERVTSVLGDAFGETYVIGSTSSDAGSDGFVLRLSRGGKLDKSFGKRGVVRLDLGSPDDSALGGSLLPSGIIVGGRTSVEGEAAAFVARLDFAGRLQRGFGRGGVSRIVVGGASGGGGASFHSPWGASGVSLNVSSEDGSSRVATVLFDHRGRPDGIDDAIELDVPNGTADSVNAAAFFRGRAIYLVGATYPSDFASGDAWIARTSLDGLLDGRFGGGLVTEHFDLEYAAFNDLAIDRRGITAVGWNFGEEDESLPPSDALIVRYRHDGTLDESFGEDGVVLLDFMHGLLACGPRVEL